MSQYFINPSSFGVPIPPVGGQGAWTEIGRTTLGAPGDDITVSGLPNKEFYMILVDIPDAPDIQTNLRFGVGGVDSGANYASRDANNGTADVTRATQNQILLEVNEVTSLYRFFTGYITNLFAHEKVVTLNTVRGETGVALGTFRSQVAGKWTDLRPLDCINITNLGTGSFPIGSELVVLGFSRFDPTLPNFWNLLGEVTAIGGEDTVTTPIFTKRKYLWIMTTDNPGGASQYSYGLRVGDTVIDTGMNYGLRFANSSFADQLFLSSSILLTVSGGETLNNYLFLNPDAREKAFWARGEADTSNAPPQDLQRNSQSGKYQITAGQINIMQMFRSAGVQTIGAGSKITVWGND